MYKDKEIARAYQKEWQTANKDRVRAYRKAWAAANPEKILAKSRRRDAKKRAKNAPQRAAREEARKANALMKEREIEQVKTLRNLFVSLRREAKQEIGQARNRDYYRNNTEKFRAYMAANREHLQEVKKAHRLKNKDYLRLKNHRYYKYNKEVIYAKKREAMQLEENRITHNLYAKISRKRHYEIYRKREKEYYEKNKDIVVARAYFSEFGLYKGTVPQDVLDLKIVLVKVNRKLKALK